MKKISKRLALTTQTIRVLQTDELHSVVGGTVGSGTSVIQPSGTSVISGTSVQPSGTSVISVGTSGTSIRTH